MSPTRGDSGHTDSGAGPPAAHSSTFWQAAVGAAASTVVLQPLDVLKSRQQYAAAKTRGSPPGGWALATSTVQREGVLALWNGVTPSVIRTSLGVGVQFTVLDYLLRLPTYSKGSQDLDGGHGRGGDHAGGHGAGDGAPGSATVLSAGAIARTVSCAALHPISVVKVRMETYREHRYTGPASALREIARSEGVAGLYAGLGAALLRDVPYSSAYIFFYQRLLSTAARLRGDSGGGAKSLPFSITFGTGLMAGLAATCISHPFDVIKTRLQLDRLPQPTSGVMGRMLGLGGVLAHVYRTEGFFGAWRGLPLRMMRRPLQTAITWSIYNFMSGSDGMVTVLTSGERPKKDI